MGQHPSPARGGVLTLLLNRRKQSGVA
jgi:hypothetical protein